MPKPVSPFMRDVGARLQALRRYHGMTQGDVAERLGIRVHALSRYENGEREPPLQLLTRLALAYVASLDFVCRGRPASNIPREIQAYFQRMHPRLIQSPPARRTTASAGDAQPRPAHAKTKRDPAA